MGFALSQLADGPGILWLDLLTNWVGSNVLGQTELRWWMMLAEVGRIAEVVLGNLEIRNLRLLSRFPFLLNSAKSFDLSIFQKSESDCSSSGKLFDSLESLTQHDWLVENYSFDFYFLLPPTRVSSYATLDFKWFGDCVLEKTEFVFSGV